MSVHAIPQPAPFTVRPRHHARTPTGYGKEEIKVITSSIPPKARGLWKQFNFHKFETKEDFEREVVRHVNTTLARSMYNFDDFAAYHGTALAMRDRLLVAWNETHQVYAMKDPKRIYCNSPPYVNLDWVLIVFRFIVRVFDGEDFG
jgi:glycogen phosphorylase